MSEEFGAIRLSTASLSVAGDKNLFVKVVQKGIYQQ